MLNENLLALFTTIIAVTVTIVTSGDNHLVTLITSAYLGYLFGKRKSKE